MRYDYICVVHIAQDEQKQFLLKFCHTLSYIQLLHHSGHDLVQSEEHLAEGLTLQDQTIPVVLFSKWIFSHFNQYPATGVSKAVEYAAWKCGGGM